MFEERTHNFAIWFFMPGSSKLKTKIFKLFDADKKRNFISVTAFTVQTKYEFGSSFRSKAKNLFDSEAFHESFMQTVYLGLRFKHFL